MLPEHKINEMVLKIYQTVTTTMNERVVDDAMSLMMIKITKKKLMKESRVAGTNFLVEK